MTTNFLPKSGAISTANGEASWSDIFFTCAQAPSKFAGQLWRNPQNEKLSLQLSNNGLTRAFNTSGHSGLATIVPGERLSVGNPGTVAVLQGPAPLAHFPAKGSGCARRSWCWPSPAWPGMHIMHPSVCWQAATVNKQAAQLSSSTRLATPLRRGHEMHEGSTNGATSPATSARHPHCFEGTRRDQVAGWAMPPAT